MMPSDRSGFVETPARPPRADVYSQQMLSPTQTEQWRRDGYVVLPGFKSRAELTEAIARAHAIVEEFQPDAGTSRFSTKDRGLLADAPLRASAGQVH